MSEIGAVECAPRVGRLLTWWYDLVPDPGSARHLTIMTLVQAVSMGSFASSSVIFFTRHLGLTATQIGLGLSMAGLFGFVGSVPVGMLADRVGSRRPLAACHAACGVFFPCYGLARSFWAFAAIACLIGLVEISGNPLRATAVFQVFESRKAVHVRAQMYTTFNVGFGLGTLGSGLMLAVGTASAFYVLLAMNAVAQLLCAVLAFRLPGSADAVVDTVSRKLQRAALRDGGFLAVAVVSGLLELYQSIWNTALPLWIVTHTDAPASTAAALLLLATVLVTAFQVAVSKRVSTVPRAARALRYAGLVAALACAIYAASGSVGLFAAILLLVLATVLMTFTEMAQSSGSWVLAFNLPPVGRQGEYQGVFGLGRGLQQTLGPILVTSTAIAVGGMGWLLLALVFAVLAVLIVPISAVAARRSEPKHAVGTGA